MKHDTEAPKACSRFFQNRACEYFPCHADVPAEEFNCLFCFCPLYLLGKDCGGKFKYLPNGIKSCADCGIPHGAGGYDHVIGSCKLVADKLRQDEGAK